MAGKRGPFRREISAAPGDIVQWMLETRNTNSATAFVNVVTRAVLAPHVVFVPGSAHFISGKQYVTLRSEPLFDVGFNAGRYKPGENSFYVWKTRLQDDFAQCSLRIASHGTARADGVALRPSETKAYVNIVKPRAECQGSA